MASVTEVKKKIATFIKEKRPKVEEKEIDTGKNNDYANFVDKKHRGF